ncbi:MAG: DNA polymerase III subunit delta [Faecousia sp.]
MAKKDTQQGDGLQVLKAHIKEKTFAPLYFFHGEETFLLHHYLEQLRKQILDELTESFNYHKLTNETFDIRAFAEAVEALPMMAERTLIWVDDVDIFKCNEADREKLIEVFSDMPDYCTVVFSYITTPWKPDKRLKKLWDAVSKNGLIVEFAKQSQRDLIAWITRHFAAQQKKISPDLCVYLIDITGGTMTALSGEIAKIASYSGADTICKADIDAVTEPVLDAVVFQMTDMLGQGDYGGALLKLRQLLQMQQEPLGILGAIGSHFRRLSVGRILLDQGKNAGELMRICSMPDYMARKTMSAAGKFSTAFYAKASELIMETDYRMKTSYDDVDRLLELLIINLAEARNG